jgi:hypothetical protein
MRFIIRIFAVIFLIIPLIGMSQNQTIIDRKEWFVSTGIGVQMSGIKPEDFVGSNIAPAIKINMGYWFSPEIALQIGYKGPYFRAISDNDRHHYSFFYGDVLLNLNAIIKGEDYIKTNWQIFFNAGAGYFYNKYYGRPNICGNLGVLNSLKLFNKLDVFMDVSAIVGWDIYQGDEDILPSIVFGLTYSIN